MTTTTPVDYRSQARRMRDEGQGIDAIATALGLSPVTVRAYLVTPRAELARRPRVCADPYPDHSDRPGPIYCVCGAATPHGPHRNPGQGSHSAGRVNGIPWGFCSVGCYEAGVDRLAALLGGAAL